MFRKCWVMLFALLLSACGGGGGGGSGDGGDLPVNFSFSSAQFNTYIQVDLTPQLQGMDGNTPNCRVTSGALPAGLSIGSNCNIVGAATQSGTFNATITLTTPNYSGSLSSPITLTVDPITFIVNPQMPSYQAWQPASSTPIVEISAPDGVTDEVSGIIAGTVAYKLAPGSAQLPPGLTLDQNTGALDGMPQGGGTYNLQVTATITNNTGSVTLGPVAVPLAVYSGPPMFNYGSNAVTVATGTPINLVPTQVTIPSGGKVISYSSITTSTAQLPAGVTLDPTTGIISGTPVVAGNYNIDVAENIALANGTTIQEQVTVVIMVQGQQLVYQQQPFGAYITATQATSTWPAAIDVYSLAVPYTEPMCTLCNNYTFSLIMAPGSTAAGVSASSPIPSWISIWASSAQITVNPPPAGTPLGQYHFYVVVKETTNGSTTVSMTPFNVNVQN